MKKSILTINIFKNIIPKSLIANFRYDDDIERN